MLNIFSVKGVFGVRQDFEDMLTKTDREVARTFQQHVKTIAPVLDLRVFGSKARGDATEESDLDVFIEVETLNKSLPGR